jgi:hypothetical protein
MLVVILIVIAEIHLWPSSKDLGPAPPPTSSRADRIIRIGEHCRERSTNARRPHPVCAQATHLGGARCQRFDTMELGKSPASFPNRSCSTPAPIAKLRLGEKTPTRNGRPRGQQGWRGRRDDRLIQRGRVRRSRRASGGRRSNQRRGGRTT